MKRLGSIADLAARIPVTRYGPVFYLYSIPEPKIKHGSGGGAFLAKPVP
jgi:hypothetical protein